MIVSGTMRRLSLGLLRGLPTAPLSDEAITAALQRALRFIERTDRTGGGSSAALQLGLGRSQRPAVGWDGPYPETTGYVIPTLLQATEHLGTPRWRALAASWVAWLLDIQHSDGWYPAGPLDRWSQPAVFNTAQVLDGLSAAWRASQDASVQAATLRTIDWLLHCQEPDGSWKRYSYRQGPMPSYYSRVALPLAAAGAALGRDDAIVAASRCLDLISARLENQSWLADMGFDQGKPVPLHTIAYTVEGLLIGGHICRNPAAQEVGTQMAGRLLTRFEVDRFLGGAYQPIWKPVQWYRCITGEAQIGLVWLWLARHHQDPRWLNSALKITDRVVGAQGALPVVRGGIPGSRPLFGRYIPMRYPNWAAKFSCDLFMARNSLMKRWDDSWPFV